MSYSYTYDSMGRPLKLTDQNVQPYQDVISGTTYGPAGELLTMNATMGALNETRSYNSLVQLTSLTSGSVNLQYNYPATQNNGKIQSQTYGDGEQISYTYDSLLRLASATSNQTWSQTFGYDGFGNLTDVNSTHTPFNPANNRPNGAVADLNGNNTAAGTFDVENRLVWANGNPGVQYSYAPDNKRVWRYVSGSVNEITLWGVNGQKLATFNMPGPGSSQVGAPSTTNVWFAGRLALKTGVAVSVDNLGSRGKYYPYGGDRGGSNPANGQEKFATYTRDAETSLDYADQRYYQPGTGMFLSPDPYMAKAGGASDSENPGSWNRYAYVGGDPINFNDPWGTEKCDVNGDPIDCPPTPGPGTGGSPGLGSPHPPKGNPELMDPKAAICRTPIMQTKYIEIFAQMGRDLNVNPAFIMAVALQESGWGLRHVYETNSSSGGKPLNNLFGQTFGGGNNIPYPNIQASVTAWENNWGKYLTDPQISPHPNPSTINDFVSDLLSNPTHMYNASEDWPIGIEGGTWQTNGYGHMGDYTSGTYPSVIRALAKCGISF